MNITLEQVLELLPKRVSLHYVDRNDSLDSCTKELQQCLHDGSMCPLYDKVDGWLIDDVWGFDEVKSQLMADIESSFDLDEDQVQEVYNIYEDHIRDAIYDRDDSTVIPDLFRNTSEFAVFYDTGYYVECHYPLHTEVLDEELANIKELLSITTDEHDQALTQMMYQASYGGNLVIYFNSNTKDIIEALENGKPNVIEFSGEVSVAIPNHNNGSGDHCKIKHTFKLPFNNKNLFLCKEVRYSYTYDVCGMYTNWCGGTHYELLTEEGVEVTLEDVATTRYVHEQVMFDKVHKEGGCSYGDSMFSRHRNVKYFNEPMYCRHECLDCGRTWLD